MFTFTRSSVGIIFGVAFGRVTFQIALEQEDLDRLQEALNAFNKTLTVLDLKR